MHHTINQRAVWILLAGFIVIAPACEDQQGQDLPDSSQEADTGFEQNTADSGQGDLGQDALGEDDTGVTVRIHPSCTEDNTIVQPTPPEFDNYIREGFTRYGEVNTPSGAPIRIFAQDQVTDAMLIRAHSLVRFYLEDVPGSRYGADKSAVAESMARNEAILIMPNGGDGEGPEPRVWGQPLYEKEIAVEGGRWYMESDYEHRDASFEEIFHLVHDTGIGTDQPGALPSYQAALVAEAVQAIEEGRWGIPVDPFVTEWLEELRNEGSLAQEYIAAVIDSYYGLWGPWDEEEGGMWGIYIAKTRDEMASFDPNGKALLEQFLPPLLTFDARIDASFTGTFSMSFDPAMPYTHKSQYLLNAILTGTHDTSLVGNLWDNRLRGNIGDNVLDGGAGVDTVIYCQPRSSYEIQRDGERLRIEGPDGTDSLVNIEVVHFADAHILSDEF